MANAFTPTPHELFFSRNDSRDPRRGERAKAITPATLKELAPGFVIGGYPDDEGVRNNGGRPGTADGPDAIRKFLYKMVASSNVATYDIGNIQTTETLKDRHETVRALVTQSLANKHRWIGLGGGHDYGYADGAGFLDWSKSQTKKPIIINFDAHLDVREPKPEINSGTPFYRLSQLGIDCDFVQIGIQRQCNSSEHLKWCESKSFTVITLEDYWASKVGLDEHLIQRTGDLLLSKRPCFVSVDIDAFAWPYAIGSSQSWPTGLEPRDAWPCLELLFHRLDVKALGIYETAPPLDFDFGTAKLAALIADTFLRKSV